MATLFNQRAYNAFLSHSSADKLDFVDALHHWLEKCASLKVWYDRGMGSTELGTGLDSAIDNSQAAIFVISKNSANSRWVESEYNRVQREANEQPFFRIATVRLDTTEPPGFLKSFKHIDATDGALTPRSGALLLESLFSSGDAGDGHPIYFSRGWREEDKACVGAVADALRSFGLKLVCDWPDQPHYSEDRVLSLMRGCGALAVILPLRGAGGATSKYTLREVELARKLDIPVLAFAQAGVEIKPMWDFKALALPADGALTSAGVMSLHEEEIEEFARTWKKPPAGEHVFVGHSLEESVDGRFTGVSKLVSRLSGLPAKVGGLVAGVDAQKEIVNLIQGADFCLIDITNAAYKDLPDKINFAMNSAIEAGVALGAGRELYLTCAGPRRSPPFMFRNKQVWFYESELELVGYIRQICARHRRYVVL